MTDGIMNLRTLLEKSSDADLLREMIGFTAQRLDGAGGRGIDQRRTWRTQSGTAQPAQRLPRPAVGDARRQCRAAHPEAAQRKYFPGFLEPRRLAEKGLSAVVQEVYVHGV